MKIFNIFKKKFKFPKFEEFKKIPRLSKEIIITEKIDGTNGVIYIDENNNIFAGSRKRWLWGSIQDKIHNDNHGFAKWVKENKEELLKLGKGYHYGEWMGKGINRNYGLKENRFYLFDVRKWCMWNEEPKLISVDPKTKIEKYQQKLPKCCYLVPILGRGLFDTVWINQVLQDLKRTGSIAVPNFMNPEGIVILHVASGQLFKKTLDGDKPKGNNE